jgi:peroxiredoxin Q/BCP
LIRLGHAAPEFSLLDHSGARVSLADFRGRTVVLFFYPKDNSTGCTQEACEFRDLLPRFGKMNAVVLGISPDTARKHQNFRKKHALPYALLVDEGHKVAERYGICVQKMLYGHKYMAVERTTYIIGPDGVVRMIFSKVKIDGHAADVAAAVKELRLA